VDSPARRASPHSNLIDTSHSSSDLAIKVLPLLARFYLRFSFCCFFAGLAPLAASFSVLPLAFPFLAARCSRNFLSCQSSVRSSPCSAVFSAKSRLWLVIRPHHKRTNVSGRRRRRPSLPQNAGLLRGAVTCVWGRRSHTRPRPSQTVTAPGILSIESSTHVGRKDVRNGLDSRADLLALTRS